MRNFRELDIWKLSKLLAVDIYRHTQRFPRSEAYGLVSQIQRCAVSIPSNIAEGCSRSSNRDFKRFLEIAIGSSFELETQLSIAHEVGYIDHKGLTELSTTLSELQMKINAFIKKVKEFDNAG